MMLAYYMLSMNIDYLRDCMSLCHYVPGAQPSTRGTEHRNCTRGTRNVPGAQECTRGTEIVPGAQEHRIVPGAHELYPGDTILACQLRLQPAVAMWQFKLAG